MRPAKRPLPLRILPNRLRESLFYRHYRPRFSAWRHLYERAELAYAPGHYMQDLSPGDVISDSIAFLGHYERPLTTQLVSRARSGGGLLVDVGANLGYFSLLWAAAHPSSRAIAIEASPRNLACLRANVAANHLQERISIVDKAAGREPGTLPFQLGPPDQTGWGGFAAAPSNETVMVQIVRLDDLVPGGARVDFLKIDIEGADTWALMGASRLLHERRVREIWFEENLERMGELGIPQGSPGRFLKECGYRLECISSAPRTLEWRAMPIGVGQ